MEKGKRGAGNYQRLTKSDRIELSLLREKGCGIRDIARAVGVHHATVSRELRRNRVRDAYDPAKAHQKSCAKRVRSKYRGMKIAEHIVLREYVKEKLLLGWTPEQIAGRPKWIDTALPYVSFRAIYKFLYSVRSEGFWIFLKSARYVPRRKRAPHPARAVIKRRIFIEQRPAIVARRTTFGHFEVDRIESNKHSRAGLLVVEKRKNRYYAAVKTATRQPEENRNALLRALRDVALVKTLTHDNDIASAYHEDVNAKLRAQSFFCHPYHSWEKGSIENANRAVRRDIPKGSDISRYPLQFIRAIEAKLNRRPLAVLDYRTPAEALALHRTRSQKQKTPR